MRYRSTNKPVALKSYNTTQQRDKVADQPETNAAWMTHFSKKKSSAFFIYGSWTEHCYNNYCQYFGKLDIVSKFTSGKVNSAPEVNIKNNSLALQFHDFFRFINLENLTNIFRDQVRVKK